MGYLSFDFGASLIALYVIKASELTSISVGLYGTLGKCTFTG